MDTIWNGEERRSNRLHADDINLIVAGVSGSISDHMCRFQNIKTKDMEAVVEFVQSIMDTTTTTKKLIWKLIVSVTVVALLGWTVVGFIYRIKEAISGGIK